MEMKTTECICGEKYVPREQEKKCRVCGRKLKTPMDAQPLVKEEEKPLVEIVPLKPAPTEIKEPKIISCPNCGTEIQINNLNKK